MAAGSGAEIKAGSEAEVRSGRGDRGHSHQHVAGLRGQSSARFKGHLAKFRERTVCPL